MPYEKAFSIIKEESGKHFDPDVVKAFFAAEDEVIKVEAMFQTELPVKEIQKGA
jgi:response regulator RpfG family c-di-GMP phosphodiesterase